MSVSSPPRRPGFSGIVAACVVCVAAGLTLITAGPAEALAPALTRYPYLSDSVQTSMTVNWGTNRSATKGTVSWGPVGSCSANTTTATRTAITVSGVAQYQWKAMLTVSPDTRYCYRVFLGSTDLLAEDPAPVFTSQAAKGSTAPYSFAVLGDTGAVDANGNNPDQAGVMAQIAASGARFAVQTGDFGHPNNTQQNFGDLQQTGPNTSAVFGPAFWKTAGATTPLFTVPGNHGVTNNALLVNFPQDRAVSSSAGKYAMVTYCCTNGTQSQSQQSGWYAFDAGNARFYMLTTAWADSNLGNLPGTLRSPKLYQNDYDNHWTPNSAEYKWLEADLKAHADTVVKFAFSHFPFYSDQNEERSDTNLQGAASLEGLLGRYGVDVAFNGHAHVYQRNTRSNQGLVTYVTGGGGADVQSLGNCQSIDAYAIGWSDSRGAGDRCGAAPLPTSRAQVFHYLKVTVRGTDVTVTPIDSLGRTFDQQTYDFSSDPPIDRTAPTAPTVRASARSSSTIDLTWSGATDDVGVTRYQIYRGGTKIAQVDGAVTDYTDSGLQAGTTYGYTVRALDAVGNVSVDSNVATALTHSETGSTTLTLTPLDDGTVDPAGAVPNGSRLRVDAAAPVNDMLIKFAAPMGCSIASASLRLTVGSGSNDPSKSGGLLYATSATDPNGGWSEAGVTWATAPARDTSKTPVAMPDPVALSTGYTVDVTSIVPVGGGTFTIRGTSTSSDGAGYVSKEGSSSQGPLLTVTCLGSGGGGDTAAPTPPANLTVTEQTTTSVSLSWTASTDNVGVTGYEVYRDGADVPIASPTGTSYTDTGLAPASTHSYTVKAVDAAGNRSPASNSVQVVIDSGGAGGTTVTLTPIADRTIDPATDAPIASRLKVDASAPINDMLLQFSAPTGCTITSASLRLTVGSGSTDPSKYGGDFYAADPTVGWSESTVSWSTAPARIGSGVSLNTSVVNETTYALDVTSLVPASGTFTIRGTSTSSDGAGYYSKEGSATKGPRLTLTCG